MATPRDPDREPPVWPSAPPVESPQQPPQQPLQQPPPSAPQGQSGYAPSSYSPPYPQPPYPQPPYPPQQYSADAPPPGSYAPQQAYLPPYGRPGYPAAPAPAKHNTKILIICAIVLVLLVAGAATFFLLRKDSKHTPTLAETKQQIATNAESFLHALGQGKPAIFCKLWDPTDLRAALSENHISSCSHVELTNPQTRTEYSSIKVVDVSQVIVNGGDAVIKASNFAPERAKDLTLIRESDGRWLVEFFS